MKGRRCFLDCWSVWFTLCICIAVPTKVNAVLPESVRAPVVRGFDQAINEGTLPYSGRAIFMSMDDDKILARVLKDVAVVCATEWKSRSNSTVLDEDEAMDALRNMWQEKKDLLKSNIRDRYLAMTKTDLLILLSASSNGANLIVSITACRPGQTTANQKVIINKTDEILRYLGEPVPGTLCIRAPDDARVYADGVFLGSGDEPLIRRLAPGRHDIKVTKTDYAPLTSSLTILSERQIELVVSEKNNRGAPLYATFSSAIVPGLGNVIYGRPKTERDLKNGPETLAWAGAAIFYVAAIMWAVDRGNNEDFLSRDSQDRHNNIMTGELAIAGVGYAVNLVGSFLVGKQYEENNRELVNSVDSR